MQVEHPAAKMLVMASQQQEQEAGDMTNWVLVFAGALLENAEELLRMVGRFSRVLYLKLGITIISINSPFNCCHQF